MGPLAVGWSMMGSLTGRAMSLCFFAYLFGGSSMLRVGKGRVLDGATGALVGRSQGPELEQVGVRRELGGRRCEKVVSAHGGHGGGHPV